MRWVLAALVALATLVVPLAPEAHAQPKLSFLIEQLKTSDDARVRTQAALALGASGDDAAVRPLCDALGDANVTVKVASAAALGKLGKPAALPCLKAAQGKESTASVKAQIEKSIATLGQGSAAPAAPAPPPPAADAKFYVAITVNNKTKRSADAVDALVRTAMQDKILSKRGFAVAPKNETAAQGGQVVKSKNLKGFLLIASVEAPVYGGSDLTQVVRVSMWSYPDRVLQGELAPKLTQSGTAKDDTESETLLIKMCAENAIESFQKIAATL